MKKIQDEQFGNNQSNIPQLEGTDVQDFGTIQTNPMDLENWLQNFQNYRYNLLKGGVKQKLEALRNIKEPTTKQYSPEEAKVQMERLKELGKGRGTGT